MKKNESYVVRSGLPTPAWRKAYGDDSPETVECGGSMKIATIEYGDRVKLVGGCKGTVRRILKRFKPRITCAEVEMDYTGEMKKINIENLKKVLS